MALKHGFKAQANRIGLALRHQMGLSATDPINLFCLAEHLRIRLVTLGHLAADLPSALQTLQISDLEAFSGAYFPDIRLVVYNEAHSAARCNSNIAHEISHHLLLHPVEESFRPSGERRMNKENEDEAAWLSGFILIPNEAATHITWMGFTDADACRKYGVSLPLLKWRLRASGAIKRLARAGSGQRRR